MDNLDFKSRDDKEVFPDYLKMICDETYRCKSIISKLLDFSRRQEPVFGKVDINSMISDVVKLLRQQKELKKLNIELNLDIGPVIIYGDYNQLKQVTLNMIMNAIGRNRRFWEDQRFNKYKRRRCIIMKFEDTGCGISSDNIDKVFEPFFSTKSHGKGIGLGLSICYGIIEET